ncbi:MAG TPA: hypothetical protein VFZ58_03720 [Candidatus Saccharimonadales bacterium]
MICLLCNSTQTEVKNSRKQAFGVWRRRICKDCGFIFTTNEYVDVLKLLRVQESIRKKQVQQYNRGNLLKAISQALSHKSDEPDAPLLLLKTTEEALLAYAAKNNFIITIQKLHEITAEVLGRYDRLAALNYSARLRLQ